jgi:hypothetical protein
MTVERFYNSFVGVDGREWKKLDGETWTLPRFQTDQPVWAAGRPAHIVGYKDQGSCGAHPGQYRYTVRFLGSPDGFTPWPYCESQLNERT